jgi:hypothetical protein
VSGKDNLTPRKLMELAIEVMRQSVPEPRPDGKASPKVGAVLVKPEVITAIGYASALSIPKRTALNHLKRFADLGLLRRIGAGPIDQVRDQMSSLLRRTNYLSRLIQIFTKGFQTLYRLNDFATVRG